MDDMVEQVRTRQHAGVVEGPDVIPKVKRQHIVPRFYLRRWAENDQVLVHRPGRAGTHTSSTRDAGTRRAFYRRTRPNGATIDDLEWSLSQLEGPVSSIYAGLPQVWPLALEEKTGLAELFAIQSVRGPRYRQWERAMTAEVARELAGGDLVRERPWLAAQIPAAEASVTEMTQHGLRMLGVGKKLGSVLASMQWTLLEAPEQRIATSDHPVVAWPLGARTRTGREQPYWAFANALEVRIPLTPTLILLATWEEGPDRPEPIAATRQTQRSTNALTVAQAETQWYSKPRAPEPIIASGRVQPISASLRGHYDDRAALAAPSRLRMLRQLDAWRHQPQPPEHVVVVR